MSDNSCLHWSKFVPDLPLDAFSLRYLLIDTIIRWGIYLAFSQLIIIIAVTVLHNYQITTRRFIGLQLMNILLVAIPTVINNKSLGFFMGVGNFGQAMMIHSLAFALLNSKHSMDNQVTGMKGLYMEILTYGLASKINIRVKSYIPNPLTIIYGFFLLFLGDIVTFFMQEWIPVNVQNENQMSLQILLLATWQFLGLEFFYWMIHIAFRLAGFQLPSKLYHKNPLRAKTLTEFWSRRWNPWFMTMLQSAYYKPPLQLGFSKQLAVVMCFIGSGLMHAVPKFFSDPNTIYECLLMFFFFFLQGVLVVFENMLLIPDNPFPPTSDYECNDNMYSDFIVLLNQTIKKNL